MFDSQRGYFSGEFVISERKWLLFFEQGWLGWIHAEASQVQ